MVTLKFAYWWNMALEGEPDDWRQAFYLPIKYPDGHIGHTQIYRREALRKGYRLDPTAPNLRQWKARLKKEETK